MVGTCPRLAQTESYVFIPRLSRRPPYPAQFFMLSLAYPAQFLCTQSFMLSCAYPYPCMGIPIPIPIPGPIFHAPNLPCSLSRSQTQPDLNLNPICGAVTTSCVNVAANNKSHQSGPKLLNGAHRHLVPLPKYIPSRVVVRLLESKTRKDYPRLHPRFGSSLDQSS